MHDISRRELQFMLANRPIHLVEISTPEEYRDFHLPGAICVPMDQNFDAHVQENLPDKTRTVVVYSIDADCKRSPRAALRLRHLGYGDVYHYEAGKADWQAAGLPIEVDSKNPKA